MPLLCPPGLGIKDSMTIASRKETSTSPATPASRAARAALSIVPPTLQIAAVTATGERGPSTSMTTVRSRCCVTPTVSRMPDHEMPPKGSDGGDDNDDSCSCRTCCCCCCCCCGGGGGGDNDDAPPTFTPLSVNPPALPIPPLVLLDARPRCVAKVPNMVGISAKEREIDGIAEEKDREDEEDNDEEEEEEEKEEEEEVAPARAAGL